MADRRDLIPLPVRIAVRNAVGGWGSFSVREIEDLFNMHEFSEQDASLPEDGGQRRTAAERFHTRIDWSRPDQARRYLDLIADILDRYPEAEEQPGSPGRVLRGVLAQGGFVATDGRLRLPDEHPVTRSDEPDQDVRGIWDGDQLRVFMSHVNAVRADVGKVASALESLQCSCFVAHVQIEPARDWQNVIEIALQTCHVLVAWLTRDFPSSKWTDQEVGWALGRGAPVIPVNVGLQPYGFLGAVQSLGGDPSSPWGSGACDLPRDRCSEPPRVATRWGIESTVGRADHRTCVLQEPELRIHPPAVPDAGPDPRPALDGRDDPRAEGGHRQQRRDHQRQPQDAPMSAPDAVRLLVARLRPDPRSTSPRYPGARPV